MPNRLSGETSPYLLQHKDNPVDWYPWGGEARARAKLEDKPIFLSIGYSACHWCHVMEGESFESATIAAQMNRDFVNIKVDREERPDLDSIYMTAVQALSGHGGWPMSVFLTPDGRPFYGGTYYPPEDRGGLPSFPKVLAAVADAYRTRKGEVLQTTSRVVATLEAQTAAAKSAEPLTRDLLSAAFLGLSSGFDQTNGGFGIQPKFPQPLTLEFLLRYWKATSSAQALEMVTLTLTKMARGGVYDQLGGGFHRYSTDTYWLAPHFEKMLYDNALLPRVYLHAWQMTGDGLFRRVVEETLEYVLREMRHKAGGFYSAQDADSEGEEGKFFVWLAQDIDALLGKEDGGAVRAFYGASEFGNWEGKNILHVPREAGEVANGLAMTEGELGEVLARARVRLLEAREQRVKPGLDDKVISSWNGLMMVAFAECGSVLGEERWVEAARQNADFILSEMRSDGRLHRTWRETSGGEGSPKGSGFLEDYAAVARGLVALYEATFEQRWLDEAVELADRMSELFWAPSESVFYDTGADHEQLVVRPRDIFDNAAPSGGSLAADVLQRLAVLTARADYERMAAASLRSVSALMQKAPTGLANWLSALDFYLATPQEVVLLGPRGDPATAVLDEVARRDYAPHRVLAGADGPLIPAPSPLFEGRDLVRGRPTAYVCENYACQLPVNEPDELAKQLAAKA